MLYMLNIYIYILSHKVNTHNDTYMHTPLSQTHSLTYTIITNTQSLSLSLSHTHTHTHHTHTLMHTHTHTHTVST